MAERLKLAVCPTCFTPLRVRFPGDLHVLMPILEDGDFISGEGERIAECGTCSYTTPVREIRLFMEAPDDE